MKTQEQRSSIHPFYKFIQSRRTVLTCALIFIVFGVLVFGIYSGTLGSPFVFDGKGRIEKNAHIRITQFSLSEIVKAGFNSSKSRPVAFISFALNYYFHQYELFGYHFVNIIIHILTGILLYLFLKTTLNLKTVRSKFEHQEWIALFAALLWLVNPVQTQSVNYIVQRLNSMAAMFFLLSFVLYLKGRLTAKKGMRLAWFGGAALGWLLALGCKQNTATLPFFIFLYEWYFFQDLSIEWLKRNSKYFFIILATFFLVSFIYLGFNPLERLSSIADYARKEFTLSERIMTQFRVVIHYLSLVFYPNPSRLNIDYDFPLSHSLIDPLATILSLGVIIGLLAAAVYLARRQRLISFCILWFFGNLVIESSIIPLAIIFEHRIYLPSMLVGLIPVLLAYRYVKLNWLRIGMLCIVLASFAYWTYERNEVWQSKITLWKDCIKKSPAKARPYYNLGEAYANLNMTDEAIPQFLKSLALDPDNAPAHHNLAVMLAEQGKTKEAITHYRKALELNPNSAETHHQLGFELSKQNNLDQAVIHFRKALQLDPDNAETQFNLGDALARQGETEQAIDHLYRAVQLKPDFAAAQNNLGGQLLKQGRMDQALDHLTAALDVDPNLAQAHNNVGIILIRKGNLDAAILHFQAALRIDPEFELANNNLQRALAIRIDTEIGNVQKQLDARPDDPVLHFKMGNLYLGKGDLSKAIVEFEKALTLRPDFLQAQNNLAMAYAADRQYDQALAAFKKLIDLDPGIPSTYYNIAVLYALQNKVNDSLTWLKKAIDMGYANWELIKTDKDLESIRSSEGYRKLVKGH